MTKPKIKIDIVSDVVCPWCYIGKRRLEKAIDHLKEDYEFEIHYHPFELNPDIPKEGLNQKEYLSEKFGSQERFEELVLYISMLAEREELNFNYNKQLKSPNTRDIHRVAWLASKQGRQLEVMEAFFKAYFEDGVDLTLNENIVEVALRGGLEAEGVEALLASEEGVSEVRAQRVYHQKIGITGVPFYIINNRYTISGAQEADTFIKALPDISTKSSIHGDSCSISGKC